MRRRIPLAHHGPAQAGQPARGWLLAGPLALPVALGRGGIRANKREGDGGTPRGRFRLKRLWWRADRHPRPRDAAAGAPHPARRRLVRGPGRPPLQPAGPLAPGQHGRPAGARRPLYDFIVEIDHNTRPRIAGRGSAVFIHVARPGFAPTAGCVALDHARPCAACWRGSGRGRASRLSEPYNLRRRYSFLRHNARDAAIGCRINKSQDAASVSRRHCRATNADRPAGRLMDSFLDTSLLCRTRADEADRPRRRRHRLARDRRADSGPRPPRESPTVGKFMGI